MRQIGSLLVFFGLFATILDFVGRVPTALGWIYNWGDGAAWAIKIGFVVVGLALLFLDNREKNS